MSNIHFKENKYTKWYYSIVNSATQRGWKRNTANIYVEEHHIIPKSIGGTNEPNNLVILTAREHFICHWLLTKMVHDSKKYPMYRALHKMSQKCSEQRILTSSQYEIARKYNSLYMKYNNPTKRPEVKKKLSDAKIGKKLSSVTREKQSKNNAKYWLGKQNVLKGSKFYNNGLEQKMFMPENVPEGWIKGRLNSAWNKGS